MNINPQFPYYLLLYVLTIILRLIRAYRARPENANADEKARYRLRYLLFGFELVNVSAGVFILLSEQAPPYVGTIMMLYVILVIVSFFFDEDTVGLRLRAVGHVAVSVIVVVVTIGAFTYMSGLNRGPIEPKAESPSKIESKPPAVATKWRVALPYVDQTLNRNFGVRDNPVKSVYVVAVQAADRDAAISMAKEEFFSERGPTPFVEKSKKTPFTMMIIESEGVAEHL